MSIKSEYEKMSQTRAPYLRRARDAAELTLPHLYPRSTTSGKNKGSQDMPMPYQSLGARGVSTLAAKLLLTVLPASTSFFKLDADKYQLAELLGDDPKKRSQFDQAMSSIEQAVMLNIEASALRPSVFTAFKHLLIAGNVLLYKKPGPSADVVVYGLDKFVVERDAMGQPIRLIVEDKMLLMAAPPEAQQAYRKEFPEAKDDTEVTLYTYARFDGKRWQVTQAIDKFDLQKRPVEFSPDSFPWLPLRLVKVDGESYGRSLIEESVLGDLRSLESLTKTVVKGSAAMAKVLFMLRPTATTSPEELARKETGDFAVGNEGDVWTLQVNKFADFRVALQMIERIETRLAAAFLLHSSVQRDAERVTAAEVQFMARELDDALGGIYSILSQELQLPLVRLILTGMQAAKQLPPLPKDIVKPVIVTGLAAMGREGELAKLDALVGGIFELGPDVAAQYVNLSDYIRRRGAYLRIDTEGLIRSDEEIQQANQQAQLQQLLQQFGPQLMQMMQQQNSGGSPNG